MTTYLHIPVFDHGGESSAASLPVADAIADLDITDLFNAIDGVVIGNLGQSTLNNAIEKDAGPGGASADPFATRKGRWLVRYHDAVTLRKANLTIPAPDLALLVTGTEFANLSAGAGLAFKAAFDAEAEGPDGNGAVVNTVQFRGRNMAPKKD